MRKTKRGNILKVNKIIFAKIEVMYEFTNCFFFYAIKRLFASIICAKIFGVALPYVSYVTIVSMTKCFWLRPHHRIQTIRSRIIWY